MISSLVSVDLQACFSDISEREIIFINETPSRSSYILFKRLERLEFMSKESFQSDKYAADVNLALLLVFSYLT